MPDSPHQRDNAPVLADEVTTWNGNVTSADSSGARPVAQIIELAVRTGDGQAQDVTASNPLPVDEGGVFDHDAGTVPTTVTVPTGARLKRIAVLPDAAGATVRIGTKPTITIPGDADFDEQIPGVCLNPVVVIGGAIRSYYVSWVI